MKGSSIPNKPSKTKERAEINLKITQNTNSHESRTKIKVEQMSDHFEPGVVGGAYTFVAFKNETSFANGTSGNGLKVIRNNSKIYSKRL